MVLHGQAGIARIAAHTDVGDALTRRQPVERGVRLDDTPVLLGLEDLPGEIRRLRELLGIDVSDDRIESFAHAATFDQMKARANQLVPGAEFFRSSSEFFRQGGAGQWRDWLHDADLARYEARVAELVPSDLAAWAHHGWRSAS